MIYKIFLLSFVMTAFCIANQEIVNSDYFLIKLQSLEHKIKVLDNNYNKDLLESDLYYHRIKRSPWYLEQESEASLVIILKFRDAYFDLYKSRRQILVSDFETSLSSFKNFKIIQGNLKSGSYINYSLEYWINSFIFRIINFKFNVTQTLYQTCDPRIIKTRESSENRGLFELEKSSKDFIDKKIWELEYERQNIEESSESIYREIESILADEHNDPKVKDFVRNKKIKLDNVSREEYEWYIKKYQMIQAKYEPIKARVETLKSERNSEHEINENRADKSFDVKKRMKEIYNLIEALHANTTMSINRLSAEQAATANAEEHERVLAMEKAVMDAEKKQYSVFCGMERSREKIGWQAIKIRRLTRLYAN